jgi:hypothetical protein
MRHLLLGVLCLANVATAQCPGDLHRALHMADMALAADPNHLGALQVKRQAVETLSHSAVNLNELGWLKAALIEINARLAATDER